MKIGLSLSFCVRDIINGIVGFDDVLYIICGTNYTNDKEFNEILDHYAEYYWSELPQLARFVANQLREQGKLIQPRLQGAHIPTLENGLWATISKD